MLVLPQLSADGLRIVAVCIHIDLVEDAPSFAPNKVSIAKIGNSGEESVLGRKIIDSDDDCCHFHVEVGVESAMPDFGDAATIDEVLTPPSGLLGRSELATMWGRFRVARSEMPESGVIRILSGVSIPSPSSDCELTITGCTLDVSGTGAGAIHELRWWPAGESDFMIEITAHSNLTINDQLFTEALKVLEGGMDRFVRMNKPAKEAKNDAS